MSTERNDRLDRSLSEAARAHHRGTMTILEGTSHDLGRGGRSTVDQDHNGYTAQSVSIGTRRIRLVLVLTPAPDANDRAAVKEGSRHLDCCIQQASRVIS